MDEEKTDKSRRIWQEIDARIVRSGLGQTLALGQSKGADDPLAQMVSELNTELQSHFGGEAASVIALLREKDSTFALEAGSAARDIVRRRIDG